MDWFEEVAEAENDEGKRDAVVEDLGDTSNSDKDKAFCKESDFTLCDPLGSHLSHGPDHIRCHL